MCRSPKLIAAYRGLHRLYVPRHPPHTFVRLTLSHLSGKPYAFRTSKAETSRDLHPLGPRPRNVAASLRFFVLADSARLARLPARDPFESVVPTITSHFRCQIAQTPLQTGTPESDGPQSNSRSRRCRTGDISGTFSLPWHRVTPTPPTYSSLQKGGDPAAGSPTATLLRLRPSHCARLRRLGPLRVPAPTSGAHSFHGVTGGVYKARERIHRGVADPRLLAIPASCSRVADYNPN